MNSRNAVSSFAPAERSDESTIDRQKKLFADYYGSLKQLYDAVSEQIFIVNQERQIVFFNSIASSLLQFENPENIYGLRPGEALGCIYALENIAGCGTSDFCSQCGAVNAVLSALDNRPDLREYRLLKKDSEARDLLVRTSPLAVMGQLFGIIAIIDISHEKRRRALERIFFHDIMNTVTSINLFAKMLNNGPSGEDSSSTRRHLLASLEQLIDELRTQKELLAAENNELLPKFEPVDGNLLLCEISDIFNDRFGAQRILDVSRGEKVIFTSDCRLLRRVLGNMIINAIEASKPGEVVSVSCGLNDGFAEFHVHNQGHMPRNSQLQIFQRSFSTKGRGNGLGTYSMKLLSERYLNGQILFSSSPRKGTTFIARYPINTDVANA